MPITAPRTTSEIMLLAISAGPAHHVSGGGDVAQIGAIAKHDTGGRRVLDRVAGDGGIGLDRNADTGFVVGIGAGGPPRQKIADDVARTAASRPP